MIVLEMLYTIGYFRCNNLKCCLSRNAIWLIQMDATEPDIFAHFDKNWRLAGRDHLPAFFPKM